MKCLIGGLLMFVLGLTGCVTKAEADARARIAFLEGQNQALMRMQQSKAEPQTGGPAVTVAGPVENSSVGWREGMTLSQAIVAAHYTSKADPSSIVIHRTGQDIPIDPKSLFRGEDFVLQPGDVIEIIL